MIDSISSGSFRPPPPPSSNSSASLSEEQSSLISETLSNYDPDNLSEADATSIVESFAEAGISPSVAFADALAESGFDAKSIGDLAGVSKGGQPPPPPGGGQGSDELDLSSIVDYLDDVDDSSSSSTSFSALLAEKFGLSEGQSLINVTA